MDSFAALDKFVQLGLSAKDLAAAKNIENAIANKHTYVFGELLHLANVQELQNSSHTKHLALLQLFAYGTYTEYLTNKSAFPPLSEANVKKLRQLSIVSFATESKVLDYDMLMSKLEIPDVRGLEDLVIDAVYAGILEAKLDQRKKQVQISSAIGRDLAPGSIAAMVAKLNRWTVSAEQLIVGMGKQIEEETARFEAEAGEKAAFEEQVRQKKLIVDKKLADGPRLVDEQSYSETILGSSAGTSGKGGGGRRGRTGARMGMSGGRV